MANRCLLHKNKLDAFKEWLISDGWTLEPTKGFYEVLRARRENRKRPLILFEKYYSPEHLTVMDNDTNVIRAFIRANKENADENT